MPATRLGQARGRETILECRITAFPHAVNYWQKDGRRIVSSTKHRIEAYDDGDNRLTLSLRSHQQPASLLTLSLRIVDIDADDYGRYDCVAANALGTDTQTIHLFGIHDCLCRRGHGPSSPQLGALLVNKPEAAGMVIVARWPLDSNLNAGFA